MRSRYDLAAIARTNGGRRRPATLRPIVVPAELERQARRFGIAVLRGWAVAIRDLVLPVYAAALDRLTRDTATDDLMTAVLAAREGQNRLVLGLAPEMNAWSVRVEEWHRRRFAASVSSALGVDVVGLLTSADVEEQVGAALERHASLIRGLNDDMRKQVEETVWREFLRQTPRRTIAKQLQERLDVGRSRADLIARDQTTKLSAELDGMRQQQAGIERYKWRHSGKAHPRPEHVARNGRVYRWDQPPADGHPGQAINCGCKAQAYIEPGR